jgi:hypothetical protein
MRCSALPSDQVNFLRIGLIYLMKRSINAYAQVNVLLRFFNNHAFFMKPKLFYTIFGYPRKKGFCE